MGYKDLTRATTSQTTPGNANDNSKQNDEGTGQGIGAKGLGNDLANEFGGEGKAQLHFWFIQNPVNPYQEGIVIMPEDYKEGKPYADYLTKAKAGDSGTISCAHKP